MYCISATRCLVIATSAGLIVRIGNAGCLQERSRAPPEPKWRPGGLSVAPGEHDMAKTVADQFAEILAAASVKRVYGIVGDSLNGLTDALRRQGKIEWVHVRHEEVAAFAAGAGAPLTGDLAVCAGACGPRGLHLIHRLVYCHRARAPGLRPAAQIP